ncbi:AAA family ATPase [Pseudodesulfovibrio sp.]|uniref:AAA family ATPase n=1 Tax=unclassified Pseudodesulfovibrio TaxID=2661612 RepID=UPI003B0090C1
MIQEFNYCWDESHWFAIQAARIAKRPLLVRGEPGVGKSSLAVAAAQRLERNYISETVTARTEPNDLLWQFDGIQRLRDAQVAGRIDKECLDKRAYVAPGVLWWAYQPEKAKEQYGICRGSCCPSLDVLETINNTSSLHASTDHEVCCQSNTGWVVLIDEIDKADSDVPNSLLEALGENQFPVPYFEEWVTLQPGIEHPLIIITTNEDRQLPQAFLRRCFVLNMEVPKDRGEAVDWFIERAKVYDFFGLPEVVVNTIAEIIYEDRQVYTGQHRPGLSEFLDFARVLAGQSESIDWDMNTLRSSFDFILRKNARQQYV